MSKNADRVKIHPTRGRIMTFGDALELGYRLGEQKLERGYVSRRTDPKEHVVQVARGGRLFVSLANRKSTQYCIRQYLIPEQVSK